MLFSMPLLAMGCVQAHEEAMDASIELPDVHIPDSGVDAGPPPSLVGEVCREPSDCGEGAICLDQLPGGYCSNDCTSDETLCPDGSSCLVVSRDGTAYCLLSCDPNEADACRNGYGCADEQAVCVPGCESDAECGDGLQCDLAGGGGAGSCFDPSSGIGDACEDETSCPAGGFCLAERFTGWPGGMCVQPGCDVETNSGCPGDAQCLPFGRGGALCIDGCGGDDDCRDGWVCTRADGFEDRRICQPGFEAENLGQVCSAGRGSCTGGSCWAESATGFPDSYCVARGCTAGAADSGCPGDGVCVDDGDEGICLDGCTGGDACRPGYACLPSDPTDAESATACLPACSDASVCGNEGFVCNAGTGLCTPAFNPEALGGACEEEESCAGGHCRSEEETGLPGGMCTLPGCRLSGDGGATSCPDGAVCIDDEEGDSEIGICVPSCAPMSESCREGYTCAVEAGAASGVCVAACSADDCSDGFTCSVESGLCERADDD